MTLAFYEALAWLLWLVSSAAGIADFAPAALICRLRIADSDVVLSPLATSVLPPGTPRCSGAKSSLAPFQQTSPTSRTPDSPPLPGYSAMASLIFLAS
jgi:hypothetical protein